MPEEESVNLFRLNTIKEGDKMPCFIILLCLCLFPFSTARCEEQAVVESLNASMLTIWDRGRIPIFDLSYFQW